MLKCRARLHSKCRSHPKLQTCWC